MSSEQLENEVNRFHHGCATGDSSLASESYNNMHKTISGHICNPNDSTQETNQNNATQQTDSKRR